MTILAMVTTIIVGFIGVGLGHDFMNSPELGTVLAITTMGGFIMGSIRKNRE